MPRFPVSLVESSSTAGLAALVFDAGFHIINSTGKVVASTVDGLGDGVKKASGSTKGAIRAAAFSRDGTQFAVCTVDKAVYIYSTETWETIRSLTTAKRTNAVAFDPNGEYLVAADKFGDAYRMSPYPRSSEEEKPSLLLGHVSILCDIKFTWGDRPYVLTCDRDEKLRVSKYPNSYNIQSFCLGHTEFVTSVAAPRFAVENAVTGSGDGTVRLWNIVSGEQLQRIDLKEFLGKYYEAGSVHKGENTFEDRTAAEERYGVLRVRAVDDARQFVVIVEGIPALLIFPFIDGNTLGQPQLVDLAHAPTDVAVLGEAILVSYAPSKATTEEFKNKEGDVAAAAAAALVGAFKSDGDKYVVDQELSHLLSGIDTAETATAPTIQSIF
ncbi:hypothetical protein GGI12_004647, partial [Dipsacomyces acuminosporus]